MILRNRNTVKSKSVLRIRIRRIRRFLGLLDPEVWIRIRIIRSSSKNSKKNLVSYCLWLLFDFLSLKNYVNVQYLQKVISRKTFFITFLLVPWRFMTRIAGSGSESGSTPKCHISATLVEIQEDGRRLTWQQWPRPSPAGSPPGRRPCDPDQPPARSAPGYGCPLRTTNPCQTKEESL
jgi:hypothetical protein